MSTYGCRHTLTKVRSFQPWTLICTVCLQSIAPFVTVRRCTGCQCALHEECYRQMVSMMQAAGDIMGSEAAAAAGANTGEKTAPTAASATPEAGKEEEKQPPASEVGETKKEGVSRPNLSAPPTAKGARLSASSLPWRSPRQDSLLNHPANAACIPPLKDKHGERSAEGEMSRQKTAATTAEAANATLPAASTISNPFTALLSSPVKALSAFTEQASSFSATWWVPVPRSSDSASKASPAPSPGDSAATAAAEGKDVTHVHVLRPTQFLLPVQCTCCYASKTPEEQRHALARAADRPRGAMPVTTEEAPISSWMGLGTEGYECTTCLAGLHKVCLYCLDPGQYVLVAPPARPIPEEEEDERPGVGDAERRGERGAALGGRLSKASFLAFFGSASTSELRQPAGGGDDDASGATDCPAEAATGVTSALKAAAIASAFQQFLRGFQGGAATTTAESQTGACAGSKAPLQTAAASPLSSSPTWNAGKSLISTYLDTSGKNSKRDANVVAILESLFQLMDALQARHPDFLSNLFNPMNIHLLSVTDGELYTRLCDSLPDADFILKATGREEQTVARRAQKEVRRSEREQQRAARAEAARQTSTEMLAQGDVSVWNAENDGQTRKAKTRKDRTKGPRKDTAASDATATVNYLPEVQLLRDCLRFAIAVYGETYRKGFLSSLFGSALVFTVSKDDVANAPKAKNDAAVTEVLSLPPSGLVLSRWSSKATEPSYCLLIDHIPQRIVLSFRGTLSDVDILTDVCAFGESFCGGMAHQGAARTVSRIFASREEKEKEKRQSTGEELKSAETQSPGEQMTEKDTTKEANTMPLPTDQMPSAPKLTTEDSIDNADKLLDTLEKLATDYPTYQIIITGHSLGGGLAVLFGVRLSHDRTFSESILKRMLVVAFAPMPTLSLPFAAEYDAVACGTETKSGVEKGKGERGGRYIFPIWSVVNGCDAVPRLQINSVDRLCDHIGGDTKKETVPTASSNATKEGSSTVKGKTQQRPSFRGGRQQQKEPKEASTVNAAEDAEEMQERSPPEEATAPHAATAAAAPSRMELSAEFHHPGRVFMLTTPWEPRTNRLVEVPRGHPIMHRMFLMRPMLVLHVMDNYTEGLRTIRSALQVKRSVRLQATAPHSQSSPSPSGEEEDLGSSDPDIAERCSGKQS